MAVEIYLPEKVYIAPSQIHGFGVFAKSRIQKDEIIEECPVIVMDFSKNDTSFHILEDYRFDWPCGFDYKTDQVMPAGYGAIYNHSDNNNATWKSSVSRNTFFFYAISDIEKDEEIFTHYGSGYWGTGNRLKPEDLK